MRIIALSDLHGHFKVRVPEGDVLILAGDVCDRPSDLHCLKRWLDGLPHSTKLFVPGNHDGFIDRDSLGDTIVLCDEAIEIGDVVFYGTPAISASRKPALDLIPMGIDVLVTHDPPQGLWPGQILRHRIATVAPKLHIFGHFHDGYGFRYDRETGIYLANVAVCGRASIPQNRPMVLEWIDFGWEVNVSADYGPICLLDGGAAQDRPTYDEEALFAKHAAKDPLLDTMPGLKALLETCGIIPRA